MGLKATDLGSAVGGKFVSVFITQTLNLSMLPRAALNYKQLPYDTYCSSLQASLTNRVHKKCELYHVSVTSLKAHQMG